MCHPGQQSQCVQAAVQILNFQQSVSYQYYFIILPFQCAVNLEDTVFLLQKTKYYRRDSILMFLFFYQACFFLTIGT